MKKILLATLLGISVVSFAEQPNIVFILADDMGWTGSSVEMIPGNSESKSDFYQTPNLQKLMEQGMVFSQAYAPASLCTPSRAGILTGKTPAELHMTTPGGGRAKDYQKLIAPNHIKDLPESEITIAEQLKKAGYATAHFGKWHLGRISPGEHGFDEHDGATGNESSGTTDNPKDIFGITERACAFMEKQSKASKPFYLQLSHYAVHTPTETLAETQKKFEQEKAGKIHSNSANAAMTFDFDSSLNTLLSKIKTLGLAENTYVVFMSDNGAPGNPRRPNNLPLNAGKGSLYEGGIRIPLIITGPGIPKSTTCETAVTGYDLLPTFCEWAGITAPKNLEGTSIAALLSGKKLKRKNEALLFHYPHYGQGPAQKPQSAIILGDFKLIRDLETGTAKLFNLNKDLGEQKNLAKTHPEKTAELEALLDKRLKEVNAQTMTENPSYDPDANQSQQRRRRRK